MNDMLRHAIGSRATRVALAVAALLVVVAFVVIGRMQEQRAHDEQVDEFYCTLSGIGPFDRGPETGRLCADLLTD